MAPLGGAWARHGATNSETRATNKALVNVMIVLRPEQGGSMVRCPSGEDGVRGCAPETGSRLPELYCKLCASRPTRRVFIGKMSKTRKLRQNGPLRRKDTPDRNARAVLAHLIGRRRDPQRRDC